jgi:hypothetical protein
MDRFACISAGLLGGGVIEVSRMRKDVFDALFDALRYTVD